jgi:hypothetical protein
MDAGKVCLSVSLIRLGELLLEHTSAVVSKVVQSLKMLAWLAEHERREGVVAGLERLLKVLAWMAGSASFERIAVQLGVLVIEVASRASVAFGSIEMWLLAKVVFDLGERDWVVELAL